jgi:hypothetical protein
MPGPRSSHATYQHVVQSSHNVVVGSMPPELKKRTHITLNMLRLLQADDQAEVTEGQSDVCDETSSKKFDEAASQNLIQLSSDLLHHVPVHR